MRKPEEISEDIRKVRNEIAGGCTPERKTELMHQLRALKAEEASGVAPPPAPVRRAVKPGEEIVVKEIAGGFLVGTQTIGMTKATEILKDYYAARTEAERIMDENDQGTEAAETAEAILDKMKC